MFHPTYENSRVAQKGRPSFSIKYDTLSNGNYGLMALAPIRLTAAQLWASFMSIKRTLKKDGKLFMRVFPTLPMTKKPSGLRMGKGKGSFHLWFCRIRRGQFILEISSPFPLKTLSALKIAQSKLPIPTRIISS